ncbi:MAG: MFS transporter [Armatimonadetes bacterium]|nr:MFS transporter [Anaerolineae bacterium]
MIRKISIRHPVYYGWWIVGVFTLTQPIAWGILYYSLSVFITPMSAELGWSRPEITAGLSLAILVSGVVGIPMGQWVDRHGARWSMTTGLAAAVVLVLLWSQVQTLLAFYVVFLGIGITMSATLYEPAFTVVANWFTRRRGAALASITFAGGLASTIFIPLSDWLLRLQGWRGAVITLAVILAVTSIPLHLIVLRRRPADLGLLPDGDTLSDDTPAAPSRATLSPDSLRAIVRIPIFWWMTLAFGLLYLASDGLRFHFVSFLIDRGYDSSTAAGMSGSIGVMQVAGRVLFAPLERRFAVTQMTVGMFGIMALALAILTVAQGDVGVWLFVALFGMVYGAATLARATLIGQFFGTTRYGSVSGTMRLFLTGVNTIAPTGAALIYSAFNDYTPLLVLLTGFALLAMGAALRLRREAVELAASALEPVPTG